MTKPRRSDATRARIVAAARESFREEGYERTTVRRVARVAEIDPSLVIRYFGSKEGLFAAAADFELRLPDFTDVPRDRCGEALVAHFLDRWEGSVDASLQVLLRTAASNEEAVGRMREIFRGQILPMVRRVRGDEGSDVVGALIASQMLGLAYCRYILRVPALLAMPRDVLVRTIGATIQSYIDMPSITAG